MFTCGRRISTKRGGGLWALRPFRPAIALAAAALAMAVAWWGPGVSVAQAACAFEFCFNSLTTTPTPGVVTTVPGQASALAVTWNLRVNASGVTTDGPFFFGLTGVPVSALGCFTAAPTTTCPPPANVPLLGRVTVALTGTPVIVPPAFFPYSVVRTSTAAESFLIPQDVILKAQKLGLTQFFYTRVFSIVAFGTPTTSTQRPVSVRVQGSAGGPFAINRMEIFFERGRNDITVPRDTAGLKVFVDIRYSGTGTLRARWRVAEPGARTGLAEQLAARPFASATDTRFPLDDWRILADIRRTLTFGDRIVLQSPEAPSIPTFITGLHLVTLEILQGQPGDPSFLFQFPVARYLVLPGGVAPRTLAATGVRLASPADGAQLPLEPPTFAWSGYPGSAQYRVEVFEVVPGSGGLRPPPGPFADGLTPTAGADAAARALARMGAVGPTVLTALARGDADRLTLHQAYLQRFKPHQEYLWRVVALSGSGDALATSPFRTFSFRGP